MPTNPTHPTDGNELFGHAATGAPPSVSSKTRDYTKPLRLVPAPTPADPTIKPDIDQLLQAIKEDAHDFDAIGVFYVRRDGGMGSRFAITENAPAAVGAAGMLYHRLLNAYAPEA